MPVRLHVSCFMALALAGFSNVQATAAVIHAGHLIAQPGSPETTEQSITIENGKAIAVKSEFVPGDKVIELKDAWVMPGLIDMHTHVSGPEKLDEPVAGQIALAYLGRPAEAVLNSLPRLKALLMKRFHHHSQCRRSDLHHLCTARCRQYGHRAGTAHVCVRGTGQCGRRRL